MEKWAKKGVTSSDPPFGRLDHVGGLVPVRAGSAWDPLPGTAHDVGSALGGPERKLGSSASAVRSAASRQSRVRVVFVCGARQCEWSWPTSKGSSTTRRPVPRIFTRSSTPTSRPRWVDPLPYWGTTPPPSPPLALVTHWHIASQNKQKLRRCRIGRGYFHGNMVDAPQPVTRYFTLIFPQLFFQKNYPMEFV